MSVTIPQYARGRNVSLMTVTPQTEGAGGVLSPGTVYDLHLLGIFDTVEYAGTLKQEEISATDAGMENYVPLKDGFTVTVGEIMPNTGQSVLLNTWITFSYVRLAWKLTADGVAPSSSDYGMVIICVRETINEAIVEGKNGVRATFKPCGIPAYYGPLSASPI